MPHVATKQPGPDATPISPALDDRLGARSKLLFDTSPLPTWIMDAVTGEFLLVNDAALEQYGYSRAAFLRLSIEDLRVPEEAGTLTHYVRARPSKPIAMAGSWDHRRSDGTVFAVQVRTEHIQFAGRAALLTLALDPERAGAPDALKMRERQLTESQELAHLGSWEWDIPTNHVTWSRELYRIFGVAPGSPSGYPDFIQRLHPDDRARVEAIISDCLARMRTSFQYECRIVRPGGEVRDLLNRHVVSVDSDGRPARMAGISLDVTEQRRAEQSLVDSERRHRDLVENASDLVTVVDPQGLVRYMSPSVRRVLGYTVPQMLGVNVFAFIHPDDAPSVTEAMQRDLITPGSPNAVMFRFRHQDGSWRTLEAVGQARAEGPGEYVIIVNSRDVTERAVAQARQAALMDELRAAQQVAEAATRAKSDFLANVSHEIRTPMHAVLGLTDVLLHSTLDASQRHYLEMVRDSGDTLLILINDILDLSKIEASQMTLEEIVVDLPTLVQATTAPFAVAARDHGIALVVDFGKDVPRFVRADPTRLRQVLTNLLGNAIKFTRTGEVRISVQQLATEDGRATLRFAVRDTGIGIPKERIDALFTDFTQVDASTTRRFGGTGLGLAIAKRLVALMDGVLSVESEVGRGSEFRFTLPLRVESPVPAASQAPAVVPAAAPELPVAGTLSVAERPLKILIAEDNIVNQQVATAMLGARGHTITIVNNGAKAVTAVERGSFDLVLMDIHMPELDGLAATAAIRALPGREKLPIVALTADALVGERERCLAAGMSDYLTKPFKTNELFAIVAKWQGERPAPGPAAVPATVTSASVVAPASGSDARPEAPAVDIDAFIKDMKDAGAESAVGEILDTFIDDAPRQLNAVLAALDSGAANAVQAAAHSFKSAAGSIRAVSLAATLLSIELAGKSGRVADALALRTSLEREAAAVLTQLREYRAGRQSNA